jgi:ribosomal protein S18 acetylase RimI-like enzyme
VKKPADIFQEPGTNGLEHVPVRQLEAQDLDAVVRIDARHSGRSRREYYQRKIAEALRESGVRISLAASTDGCFAGFLLGRVYFGEFGVPEAVAIIDSIGVDPTFAGKKVGAALLAQLESNMRALGVDRIQTQVEWDSFRLLGFLDSMGFGPAPVLTLEKHLGNS